MTFNVFNALRHPTESDCCFYLDNVDVIVSTQMDHLDPLEASLLREDISDMEEEVQGYV